MLTLGAAGSNNSILNKLIVLQILVTYVNILNTDVLPKAVLSCFKRVIDGMYTYNCFTVKYKQKPTK